MSRVVGPNAAKGDCSFQHPLATGMAADMSAIDAVLTTAYQRKTTMSHYPSHKKQDRITL